MQIDGGTLNLGELRVGGRETIADNLLDWGASFTANGGGTGSVVQNAGDVNITYSSGAEPPIQSLYIGDAGLTTGNTEIGLRSIARIAIGIASSSLPMPA